MPFLQEGYGCFPLPPEVSQGSVLEPPGAGACCEFYSPACAPTPGQERCCKQEGLKKSSRGYPRGAWLSEQEL